MKRRDVFVGALGLLAGLELGGCEMTSPIEHGFPDWGRQISASDIEVFNAVTVQSDIELNNGTFFVGNLPYIWLRMLVNGGGVRLTLEWLTAATGGTVVANNLVDTRITIIASGPFAVLAPYVRLITTVDATPRTVTLRVWQSFQQGQESLFSSDNALISVNGATVIAGTTAIDNPIRVRWGWGFFQAVVDGGVSTASRLFAVDYLNATTLIDIRPSNTASIGRLIPLPAAPIQAATQNADGVDRTYSVTVLMHPGPF